MYMKSCLYNNRNQRKLTALLIEDDFADPEEARGPGLGCPAIISAPLPPPVIPVDDDIS